MQVSRSRMEQVPLRVQMFEASRAIVAGCSAGVSEKHAPIVACAIHKTQAVDAELDVLTENEGVVMAQLATIRDAAIAAGFPAEEVTSQFESRTADLLIAVSTKRVALQTEAVAADAALEGALAAVAALSEVRRSVEVSATCLDSILFPRPPTPTPLSRPPQRSKTTSSPPVRQPCWPSMQRPELPLQPYPSPPPPVASSA